jgi:isoprenylcysteine carboxyl methyltransferase (ICMT) family protein YpbQ
MYRSCTNLRIFPWKRRFSLIVFADMLSSQCVQPIAEAWSCALLIVPEIFTLQNGHFYGMCYDVKW